MLPLLIGIGIAVVIAIFASVTRFDQDKSFYPTVLIVIAFYYVLFAFMSGEGIVEESIVASIFLCAALFGGIFRSLVTGIGIALHGVFDFLHPLVIYNSGVPEWWPAFCGGIDITLGAWVIWLTLKSTSENHASVS